MDFKDLKKIIDLVKENDIVEFDLQDGEFRLATKLRGSDPVYVNAPVSAPAPSAPSAPAAPAAPAPAAAPAVEKAAIKSPMVGTFYRASSPDAEPLAKPGTVVDADSTVCIIEAMKVMNEIKADVKGRITRVMVENAQAVEFGQSLFEIEPL